jgi:hypothetical protein
MRIIIDTDLRQAVASFAGNAPAQTIVQKSQDTASLDVYFVQSGVVQDLGSGTTLKFGLIAASGGSLLVLCTSFSRQVDANGLVYYLGYPIFNTSNLLTALGSSTSIQCVAEIRFQQPSGEIDHSLDITYTIWRTILSEITSDTTAANFTTPAIGSNVTVQLTGSTTWLLVGQQLTITGAGIYQVISITDATHFVAQNTGAAGNASSGTVINSGAVVAGAPVNNLTTYPASSNIELISTRDVASGHAGLDSNALLLASEIPVDGKTIIASSGKIAAAGIITSTLSNFTTPAASATVSVSVGSTSGLAVGQYLRIPIAGYYSVSSITDSTHAVLTNSGDPYNAASGVTITSGAVLLPAQATSAGGSAGQNAYTSLTSGFTVPAVNATVNIVVGSTSWMGGNGYVIFITGAGYYAVSSITNSTNVVVTNLGTSANTTPGSTVGSGSSVNPAGAVGSSGANGAALSAYDSLQATFVMPAAAANVTATIKNTAWLAVGQVIFVSTAGYFSVFSINSATSVTLTNLNYAGNASVGTTIALNSAVSAGGIIGPTGSGASGKDSFSTLTSSFTQPAVNATVSIQVDKTAWMIVGQYLFIKGGGYYTVSSITDASDVVVTNLGYTGNAAVSSTVANSGGVSPGGVSGLNGTNAYSTTQANFTQPSSPSGTVTVTVDATGWMSQGQYVYIQSGGYYTISSITDSTHVVLTNVGISGNATSGTTVSSGAKISPAGAQGASGSGGSGGISSISDAETSSGVSIISNSAGLLKRVTSNDGSVIQTDNGTSVDFSAKNVGIITPDSGVQEWQDFTSIANGEWTFSGNGVSPAISTVGCDSVNKGNGVVSMLPGTASGNRTQINLGPASAATDGSAGAFVCGLGILDLRFRVWIPSLYTSTSNYSITRIGIITDDGTGTIKNGIYFEYNYSSNASVWTATTASAGTLTRSATTGSMVAAQWMALRILTDTAWANAYFYLNGVLIKTLTSFTLPVQNCPINMYNAWAAGSGLQNSYVDYAYAKYIFSRNF